MNPLEDIDLIRFIFSKENVIHSCDFKAIISINRRFWAILHKWTPYYMNAVSTFISRHMDFSWLVSEIWPRLTEDVIMSLTGRGADWTICLRSPYVSRKFFDDFARKYIDKIQLRMLLQNCSVVIIREFISKEYDIHWSIVSANPNLDETFIRDFAIKLDWFILSSNRALTLPLIREFMDKCDDEELCLNPNLTLEFINEHKLDDVYTILSHHIIGIDFIEMYINEHNLLDENTSCSDASYDGVDYWDEISQNPNLTTQFIEKYIDLLIWDLLSANRRMTVEMLEKFYDRIEWSEIINNPNLTLEFLEKHIDDVCDVWYV